MKLAEALLTRGNLQSRFSELQNRLANNAIVQEGEQPAENPKELLRQAEDILKQQIDLVTRINLTNASVEADGRTITAMLAERDALRDEIGMYREFLDKASSVGRRARGSEIRVLSTVPVAEIQKTVDHKAQELRKLEIRIQEINWTTDLIEK